MSENFNQLSIALQDRYQLKAELGRGGMATVYLAQDLQHGRRVAIKVLHPDLAGAVGHDRFLREIRIASDLSHPHILPLLDSGSTASGTSTLPYYVMPFVEGETLRAKLQRERQLPIQEAVKIAHDVATALSYAHAHGVVHRDIKPENILLSGNEAVVADFGIARAIDRASEGEAITSAGLAVGTPAYMSPEQAAGHQEVDGRSDIYSLGCVLYEMLGGHPPFTGPSANAIAARHRVDDVPPLRTIRPSVPPSLEAVILQALEKVPADRFKTAYQFAAALEQQHTPSARTPAHPTAVDSPPTFPTATVETPAPRWLNRHRARQAAVGAILLTTVVLAAWWMTGRRSGANATRYSSSPEWSAWRIWDGEFFPVFGVSDSMLVVKALGADDVQVFDGQRWRPLAIPDSFELLRYVGTMPGEQLLATKRVVDSTGQPELQFWWMSVSPQGIRPLEEIGDRVLDNGRRPRWWSDGREVVLWLDDIRRLDGTSWTREASRTRGYVRDLWGNEFQHRHAIPSSRDSVLVFDGISWSPATILPGTDSARSVYQTGATFSDGTTVVVGEECLDDERCRPLVIQQEASGKPWERINIPGTLGIPVTFPADTTAACHSPQFTLTGVAGQSRSNYFIWGSWSSCVPEHEETISCPPRQPCFWHMREGKLTPVEGMLGRLVQSVGYTGTIAYALLDDGTLSREIQGQWRMISQVPGLALRMVGASPRMVVRLSGSDLHYEPGPGDQESDFSVVPMQGLPTGVSGGVRPRRLLVRDTLAALLTEDGSVHFSRCRKDRVSMTGAPEHALRCAPWSQPAVMTRRIRDVAILPDGRIIGVGPRGLIVIWHDGSTTVEKLPLEVREDSLWGVSVGRDGRPLVIGSTAVSERDSSGRWSVLRRIQTQDMPDARFLVLSNGDFVLVQRQVEVWDRTADSLPVVVLLQHVLGQGWVGAIHALEDGRLVLGLSNPDESVAGGLVIWAAPARANQSQTLQLPVNMDITDLTDDGRFLHVVGRGGSLRIPLDSLPFALGQRH